MKRGIGGPLTNQLLRQLSGFAAAVRFLTSLPTPATRSDEALALGHALAYFPLVGLLIGAILVAFDRVLDPFFARPMLNFLLVAGLVLLSGGLHLDGLIDAAHGLFSPGPAEQRLAQMQQSWATPRGTLAALTQLLVQYGALSSLGPELRPAGLLLAPTLGRWAIVYAYVVFPYARRTSSLSLVLKQSIGRSTLPLASGFALLTMTLAAWPSSLLLLPVAWLVASAFGWLSRERLGGMSGDVYGAVEQVAETLTLLLLPMVRGS